MTVRATLDFVLRQVGCRGAEGATRIDTMLAKASLQSVATAYPSQLSRGQQQLLAVARAMITQPKVILIDEPLSSLDVALQELSRLPRMTVAVISERPLNELRRLIGVGHLIYIRDHGREMWQDGRQAERIGPPSFQDALARIQSQFVSIVADIDGVLVEDKGRSVSLHYRLVPTGLKGHLLGRFVCEIIPLVRSSELTVRYGRKVIELCARLNWVKCHAALWLMNEIHRRSVLPIYIAGDHTDGGAFGALPEGITIRVGARSGSEAHYYVRDVEEVMRFLRWMGIAC